MTPKEKAKELRQLFAQELIDLTNDEQLLYFRIDECSLILIDEILKQCWDYRDIDLEASYGYWQKVKKEIETTNI
jgi:hypothetical protein